MVTPQLDMSMKCIKYLLLAANALFTLTAVLLISIGTSFFALYEDHKHFFDPSYFTPAAMLIFIATFVLVISFLGWCGALQESTCMVLSFATLLSTILFFEIGAVIMAYFMRDNVMNLVRMKINSTMHEYEHNLEAMYAIDAVQYSLQCCGYNSHEDWKNVFIDQALPGDISVPRSCCISFITELDSNSLICNEYYHEGCNESFKLLIHRNAMRIGIGVFVIAIIQLTGIIFACTLGHAIRGQKTLREMHRWQYDEEIISEGYYPVDTNEPYSRTTYLTPVKTITPAFGS